MTPRAIACFILCQALCFSAEPSQTKLQTLYNSLDPCSVSQHLAFYELYPQTNWGQMAIKEAWRLMAGKPMNEQAINLGILHSGHCLDNLVHMVNRPVDKQIPLLDHHSIQTLKLLAEGLHHHELKGHSVWSEEELLKLPPDEIDLARGLFLSQFGNDRLKIQTYEALIDLMALQILTRLKKGASPEEKIIAINTFIFDEMGFRFPPHSLYAKDIDLYTFLPSVLDSRRGVCLGVSILYLCIAQRLALSLEMITPPGHIYVRYRSNERTINIETTARGIHLDSEDYLTMNNRLLQQRTILEVIGMAHFNQASVHWQNGEYAKALQAYQKAEPYMKEDPLLKELMGYVLLLTGDSEEGERKLREVQDFVPDYALVKNTMAEDYFLGHIDAEGIGVIFKKVDEDRQSILAKKEALQKTLEKYPRFRAGLLNLAITWLQLHRLGEALEVLNSFQAIEAGDPEAHYYLSVLHTQRRDFPNAWHHVQQAEKIAKARQYEPKMLKELRRELLQSCPE
jgi:Flp pilus assembly protein TadD